MSQLDLRDRDLRRIFAGASGADTAGTMGPLQQALMHRRGWLRMLAPRSAGGFELALPQVVRLEEKLAASDGSIGWTVTLCAGAGWFAGFLPPALAREIIGTPRVCVAGSGGPTGHADIDGDGFRLTGRWDYASGAPFATHFTLNAILRAHGQVLLDDAGAPRIRAFIVPAAEVEVVPSWRSIGLRATASHSYRIDNRWVHADHGFQIDAAHATADGPLYRFPFLSLAYVTLAANAAGMAGHFLELAAPCIARRKQPITGIPLMEAPGVAQRLHAARSDFDAARTTFYRLLEAAWELVLAGGTPDAQPLHAASLHWVAVSRKAVDELYPFCGLYAASGDTAINRVWRDFHTATQHTLLLP